MLNERRSRNKKFGKVGSVQEHMHFRANLTQKINNLSFIFHKEDGYHNPI